MKLTGVVAMSRALALIGLVAACGCASSGGSTPDVAAIPISDRIVTVGGGSISLASTATTVGIPGEIAAAPAEAFKALLAVYEELKITATEVSSVDRVIGNPQFKARRRLGGVAMQTYLECGGNPGQPNAETYDIVLSLQSTIAPGKGDGSTLTTRVQAVASNPGHGEANQMRCSSTSELELRILRMVRARIAAK